MEGRRGSGADSCLQSHLQGHHSASNQSMGMGNQSLGSDFGQIMQPPSASGFSRISSDTSSGSNGETGVLVQEQPMMLNPSASSETPPPHPLFTHVTAP